MARRNVDDDLQGDVIVNIPKGPSHPNWTSASQFRL